MSLLEAAEANSVEMGFHGAVEPACAGPIGLLLIGEVSGNRQSATAFIPAPRTHVHGRSCSNNLAREMTLTGERSALMPVWVMQNRTQAHTDWRGTA